MDKNGRKYLATVWEQRDKSQSSHTRPPNDALNAKVAKILSIRAVQTGKVSKIITFHVILVVQGADIEDFFLILHLLTHAESTS